MNKLKIVLLSTSISILSICAMDISKSVIPLKTSDGAVIPMTRNILNNFTTINDLVSDMGGVVKQAIPLVNVSAKNLRTLIELQKLNIGQTILSDEKKSIEQVFKKNTINITIADMVSLMKAANYLNNKQVLQLLINFFVRVIPADQQNRFYFKALKASNLSIGIVIRQDILRKATQRILKQNQIEKVIEFFNELKIMLGSDLYDLVSYAYALSGMYSSFPPLMMPPNIDKISGLYLFPNTSQRIVNEARKKIEQIEKEAREKESQK